MTEQPTPSPAPEGDRPVDAGGVSAVRLRVLLVGATDAEAAWLARALAALGSVELRRAADAAGEPSPGELDLVLQVVRREDRGVRGAVERARAFAAPLVVLTADGDASVVEEALSGGADEVLRGAEPAPEALHWVIACARHRRRIEAERAAYTAEVERHNHALEQFARTAAHDLKSPLALMHMELSWLLGSAEALPEKARHSLREALGTGEQLRKLVDDLHTFARTGDDLGEPVKVDCNALLAEARTRLAGRIAEAGAEVTADMLPTLWGNPKKLTELLFHLIANAVQFRGSDPPRVHVSAEYPDSAWLFSVQDNGRGIPQEDHERVFEPFTRRHSEGVAGNGLGLAICRRVVQAHGGRIWIESTPGAGATVYFTLPNRPPARASAR